MGSPHYMSPEQIRSTKDVDPRADIWSMGVVLYELLTGKPPFHRATEVTGIIAQVLYEPHPPVRAQRPEVPPELEAIIDTCLSKDPAKRYASAAALAVALVPFAPKRARAVAERASAIVNRATGDDLPVDSLPPPPPTATAPPTASASASMNQTSPAVTATLPGPAPKAGPRAIVLALAGAVVVLGLVGTAVATLARSRVEASPAVASSPPATAVMTATAAPPPEPPPRAEGTPSAATGSAAASAAPPPSAAVAQPVAPARSVGGTRVAPAAAAPRPKPAAAPATPAGEGEIRLER
jgi:serine/threonine-protein kinase